MFGHTDLSLLVRRKVKSCILAELIVLDHLGLVWVIVRFALAQFHLDNLVQKAQIEVKSLFGDLFFSQRHIEQNRALDATLPQS